MEIFKSLDPKTLSLLLMFAMAFGAFLGMLVAGQLLRGGIWMFNKIRGTQKPPSSVPMPGLARATGIMLVNGVIVNIVEFTLIFSLAFMPVLISSSALKEYLVPLLFLLNFSPYPIGLLVTAWFFKAALPTTFWRALGVQLCAGVIAVLIAGAFLLIAVSLKHSGLLVG